MNRIRWPVFALCLLGLGVGAYFAFLGWFGLNMYGDHPDMHIAIWGGGLLIATSFLIAWRWGKVPEKPRARIEDHPHVLSHIVASIELFKGRDGCRHTPFVSDYRPLMRTPDGVLNSAAILLLDRESMKPGESATVEIRTFMLKLAPGMMFELTEGSSNPIGKGEVLRVLSEERM